jgi:hypothetical protein
MLRPNCRSCSSHSALGDALLPFGLRRLAAAFLSGVFACFRMVHTLGMLRR